LISLGNLLKGFDRSGETVFITGEYEDMRAFGDQLFGKGKTDAAGTTRDQC
jgi:hypothetical protein